MRDANLLVGSMDGSVSMLHASSGACLQTMRVHSKYVVRVCWAPDGEHFLSASWDGHVCVYTASPGRQHEAGSGTCCFQKLGALPFASAVQDVTFLPGSDRIVVALRGTNYLRIRKFPDLQDGEERVNMNQLGDDHISFTASHLSVSPNGKYLLVSTDGARILLLRISNWSHLSTQIYGLPLDNFHNPIALWHASGFYIMASAAAGQIYTFHVGSGKVVSKYKAHEQNVRWIDYDPKRNLLLTCSFDRSVRVFK